MGAVDHLVYADFGVEPPRAARLTSAAGRPVDVSADLTLDIESWVWTFGGLYASLTTAYTADLLFGTRYIDMSNALDWRFDGDVSPAASPDAPARARRPDQLGRRGGLKGRAYLGDDRRWFVPYYVDIGTGQSKLTWQVNAGVGYQFDWGAVIASWRSGLRLRVQRQSPGGLSFNGPLIGVVFQW